MGLSCLVVPPCTLVLLTGCRRKSLLLLHLPSRLRSLLLLSVNTPYGSVAPSLVPCPPLRPCGSPRKNTTSPALASSIANASKHHFFLDMWKKLSVLDTIVDIQIF